MRDICGLVVTLLAMTAPALCQGAEPPGTKREDTVKGLPLVFSEDFET